MYQDSSNNTKTNGNELSSSSFCTVDLRSDTVSQPTAEMRTAMANAIVGDDVYGEDPTVVQLQDSCAQLFEKEAALFVPTGTMANLLAVLVHCSRRGAECIVGDQSHVFLYEQAGAAQFAGVQLATIANQPDGTYSLAAFRQRIRGDDPHEPSTQLAIVENTHNMCGGKVVPLRFLDEWSALCVAHGIRRHMDGARVFNAAEALGVPVARVVRDVDSVCFCLSKGLSAPVGSMLLGTREFIKSAHRLRKALGGGMRQVGVLAAAGLVALQQIVPRLGDDHRRAQQIAAAIAELRSKRVRIAVDGVHSNILCVEVSGGLSTDEFVRRLAEVRAAELKAGVHDAHGCGVRVLLSARDWAFVRLVIYHQIDDEATALVCRKIAFCVAEWDAEAAL